MFGAGIEGNRISSFRTEWKKIDRVELEMAFAFQLVAAEMGYYFSAVVQ